MTGDRPHETVDDVVSYWRAFAREKGFSLRAGVVSHELTWTDRESEVYISASRLVADCPNPECNGAAACWRENPDACCLDCGTVFKLKWPPVAELAEASAILLHRPMPLWRNWRASHKEETVQELKAQNLSYGDSIPGGKAPSGPHPLAPTIMRG